MRGESKQQQFNAMTSPQKLASSVDTSEIHWTHSTSQHQSQAAVLLTVKGCITAATYWMRLRILTACQMFPIFYSGPADDPSQPLSTAHCWFPLVYNGMEHVPPNCTFVCGNPGQHLICVSLGPPKSTTQTASWLVQLFLWGSQRCPTDRHTQRPCYICSERLHLCSTCMQCGLKLIQSSNRHKHSCRSNQQWSIDINSTTESNSNINVIQQSQATRSRFNRDKPQISLFQTKHLLQSIIKQKYVFVHTLHSNKQ